METRSRDQFFGEFGGQYVAEILYPALKELDESFKKYMNDKEFISDFKKIFANNL